MKDGLLKKFLHRIHRKIKKVEDRCEEFYTKKYIRYCRVNPKKLVFDNFGGKGYGDNPKYIMEEIIRQKLKWELVWLTNDLTNEFPRGVRAVKYGSMKALRELASAKVWIDNIRNSERPPKKQEQVYLQTWHGGPAFKKVEKAAEEYLNINYVERAKQDGTETDSIMSACEIQTKDFIENFWLNKKTEILKVGQPSNDILFGSNRDIVAKETKIRLGINECTKVILYAPTFRDDLSTDCYMINTREIIDTFRKKYGCPFVMLVRLHPNVQMQDDCVLYDDLVINVTRYPDIKKLYLVADYLITDYSSSAFEFSLLSKPVFLHVDDYKKYEESRGLALKLEDTCFLISKSNQELIYNIKTLSEKKYREKVNNFKDEVWRPYDKGNASHVAVEWIKSKM